METESRIVSLEMRMAELERRLEMVMRELQLSEPSDSIRPKIEACLREGNKIAAIQAYREATNCSLKASKDYVEALERTLPGR